MVRQGAENPEVPNLYQLGGNAKALLYPGGLGAKERQGPSAPLQVQLHTAET